MVKRPSNIYICSAVVHIRKNGNNRRNAKHDFIYNKPYNKLSMILFITNLITNLYNDCAIHKAIGKQARITKILLTGIFGIFSQTLTKLVTQIQEVESHYLDDNNAHHGNNIYKSRQLRQSTDSPYITDHTDNNEPIEVYVDTNYKHFNTTIRGTEKGIQLRTL